MDISAMDPKDIPGLFDAEVVGPDGEKVGTIQQIFADEVTGAATFVTVLSQGHEYFIPVRGAEYSTSQVNVPFSRNLIETAPEASEEDDLSRDREAEVYGHYGMEPARRSGLEISDDDDIAIAHPGRGAVSESDIVEADVVDDSEPDADEASPRSLSPRPALTLRIPMTTKRTVPRCSATITVTRKLTPSIPPRLWGCLPVPSCVATSSQTW